jgi:hypothetical protein
MLTLQDESAEFSLERQDESDDLNEEVSGVTSGSKSVVDTYN